MTTPDVSPEILELAIAGTNDTVLALAIQYVPPPANAIDLATGKGPLADQLAQAGYRVIAADHDPDLYKAKQRFHLVDLDEPEFSTKIDGLFNIVAAVEIIEHLENPIGFSRQLRALLANDGVIILTTPNLESVPTRIKFWASGKVRLMDELNPWHISPIFLDLFVRKCLPRADLRMIHHQVIPENGYELTRRRWILPALKLIGRLLRGRQALHGDSHIFVLKAA